MINTDYLRSDTNKASQASQIIAIATGVVQLLGIWGILPTDFNARVDESMPIVFAVIAGLSGLAIRFRNNYKTDLTKPSD